MCEMAAAKKATKPQGDRSFVVRVGIARDAVNRPSMNQHRQPKHQMVCRSFGE
jgi:hypothetical protein